MSNQIIEHYLSTDAKSIGIELIQDLKNINKKTVKSLINDKRSNNQRCFVAFPHEWKNRSEQIISHIKSYSNINPRIFNARSCIIKEIPMEDFRKFCDLFHIQGRNKLGIKSWGLFFNNELLGGISLGHHHRKSNDLILLLDRLCFKNDVRIRGGASKLFSHSKKWAMEQGIEKIISFSDNRWSLGSVYEKLEFTMEKELSPDYFYVSVDDYCNYKSKQSQKKDNTNCPDGITEREWAKSKGLIPVYDGGKKRWVYKLKLNKVLKNPLTSRRHGYFNSKKAGLIYYQSSYELRAAVLLDEMKEVKKYTNQVRFLSEGKNHYIDFLVTWEDDTYSVIEVKPKRKIDKCQDQIRFHSKFALKQGWKFCIWSEEQLGFKSEHYITKWADEFISKIKPVNFVKERKNRSLQRSKKHYENVVSKDTVEVFCNFCNETHNPLRLTYDKNIERNGEYICERHGGHIAGKKPKKKKENPYLLEGKKKCNKCSEIKLLEEFGDDKSRSDRKSTRCKKCRAEIATAKYQNKKLKL